MPRATFISASPPVSSLTTTITLTTPPGLQPGDALLFWCWTANTSDSHLTAGGYPPGWVLISEITTATAQRASLLCRAVDASEPASHVFTETTSGSGNPLVGIGLAYRWLDTSAAVVAAAVVVVPGSTAAFPCPSLTPSAYSDLYLGFTADHSATATAQPPSGATELVDGVVGTKHVMALDLHRLVTGSSGTQSVTMSATSATPGLAVAYVLRALTVPTPAVDRTANALARLPHMYRSADPKQPTNTEKLIRALMAPADELQTALVALLTQRTIDTAVGAQLDVIRRRVGAPSPVIQDDEITRRYVRAQISANKSNGGMEDVYTIARLVVNDPAAVFVFRNEGVGAFVLSVGGIALTDVVALVLIAILIKAAGGGVRPILEYSSATPSTVFRFDVGPGYDVGHYATALEHV